MIETRWKCEEGNQQTICRDPKRSWSQRIQIDQRSEHNHSETHKYFWNTKKWIGKFTEKLQINLWKSSRVSHFQYLKLIFRFIQSKKMSSSISSVEKDLTECLSKFSQISKSDVDNILLECSIDNSQIRSIMQSFPHIYILIYNFSSWKCWWRFSWSSFLYCFWKRTFQWNYWQTFWIWSENIFQERNTRENKACCANQFTK